MSAFHDLKLDALNGGELPLAPFKGQVVLVVNVASKCGLTPQYEGLEKLYQSKRAEGLEVLGFPANNFKEQEPGSEEEIKAFCSLTYGVQFPLFSKVSVTGADQHPLYAQLTAAQPAATGEGPFRERLKGYGVTSDDTTQVLWNFEKFLVGRSGKVVARFAPDVAADDPRLLSAIDAQLALTA